MKRDKRGRFRVTINGIRLEVNRNNEVRIYRRYSKHRNSERRTDVLNMIDMLSLQTAIRDTRRAWLGGGHYY